MAAVQQAYDVLFKILLIGDSGSLKTEMLTKYMGDVTGVDDSLAPTLGLDYRLKDVTCRGKKVKLQLWDTAGQERFRSVTSSYYRGAQGCLLVFNVARPASFSSVSYWIDEIKTNAPSNFQTVLVATGLEDSHAGDQLVVAREFAKEKEMTLREVNIEETSQVEEAFNTVIEKIMSNQSRGHSNNTDSLRLGPSPYTNNSSKCDC